MPHIATDLEDLATDFAADFLKRAEESGKQAADVLKWAAKEAETAAKKWADNDVSDAQFARWVKKLATVRVPAKLGAIAKRKARAELDAIIGSAFKAISILVGAL